jgi:uncharacterized RDD family membrane protein YckC
MRKKMKQSLFAAMLVIAVSLSAGTPRVNAQSSAATLQIEVENPSGKSNSTDSAADGKSGAEGKTTGVDRQEIVVFGRNVELKAGDSAEVVVVIGGSAKVHGKVRNAVVVIGGNIEVDGEVGDAVVAVIGNIHVKPGAKLNDDVVSVGGDVKVDAKSKIEGEVVAVGGVLNLAEGAIAKAREVGVPFLAPLGNFLLQCVLKMRPLAPQVGFVWVIAGVFFLFYLLVAAAFPQPVQICVSQLEERPIATFLFGVLAKLLFPVISLILICTGVGLLVVPFFVLAVFIAGVVGKVALLEWVGLRVGHQSGISALKKPLIAFLLGSLILTLFYNVWVVGLIAYMVFGTWGLGVAVTAVIASVRRRPPATPSAVQPPGPMPPAGEGFPSATTGQPGAAASGAAFPPSGGPAMSFGQPSVPDALSALRAGFWERMAAAFLDIILVIILTSIVHLHILGFLITLAYFTGMWTWRGTTIGGIVLGLKVVRVDGQPLTFTVALVRSLAAAFSAVVLFLGFFWIGWDPEKQGWHDKIAGTVVVRLPKAAPLVCI